MLGIPSQGWARVEHSHSASASGGARTLGRREANAGGGQSWGDVGVEVQSESVVDGRSLEETRRRGARGRGERIRRGRWGSVGASGVRVCRPRTNPGWR